MDRRQTLAQIRGGRLWDVAIIGGGATGLGCAVDAAARGYRTVLVEGSDFAKGTSSRSTKLIHGGVRYLQQGDVSLVFEALRERGCLLRNAPHLVHPLRFLVPCYRGLDIAYYATGLMLYDLLGLGRGISHSRPCSAERCLQLAPGLDQVGLRGGVTYWDAQFDDARLAISLARTAGRLGAVPLNHASVVGLTHARGRAAGLHVRDELSGESLEIPARVVVNAAGVFSDWIRELEDPQAVPQLRVSRGSHIVLPSDFLPGDTAVLVPRTSDRRVVFFIPWEGKVLVGTTDNEVHEAALEPRPSSQEIDYLLSYAADYLERRPTHTDILSCFAGLRPLIQDAPGTDTARLSREHRITVSKGGMVTVAGGKWTTYRAMAEEAIDCAAEQGGLPKRESPTRNLRLEGWRDGHPDADPWGRYGSDGEAVAKLAKSDRSGDAPLVDGMMYRRAEVTWGVREEMACTIEDVLARRTRALFLDARAAIKAAPEVARMMAAELGQTDDWISRQLADFTRLAQGYLPMDHGGA